MHTQLDEVSLLESAAGEEKIASQNISMITVLLVLLLLLFCFTLIVLSLLAVLLYIFLFHFQNFMVFSFGWLYYSFQAFWLIN
jgi:hypothetical protein